MTETPITKEALLRMGFKKYINIYYFGDLQGISVCVDLDLYTDVPSVEIGTYSGGSVPLKNCKTMEQLDSIITIVI